MMSFFGMGFRCSLKKNVLSVCSCFFYKYKNNNKRSTKNKKLVFLNKTNKKPRSFSWNGHWGEPSGAGGLRLRGRQLWRIKDLCCIKRDAQKYATYMALSDLAWLSNYKHVENNYVKFEPSGRSRAKHRIRNRWGLMTGSVYQLDSDHITMTSPNMVVKLLQSCQNPPIILLTSLASGFLRGVEAHLPDAQLTAQLLGDMPWDELGTHQ